MDDQTTIAYLRKLVDNFREARQWHDPPKELVLSMAVEVGELAGHFRFRTEEEVRAYLKDPAGRQAIAHEIADVLYHVLALASTIDFDLSAVFRDKLSLAASRYPVPSARPPTAKGVQSKTRVPRS
jgi:NTP pyrophosphatase (non-canonical NTP hydrolase)